MADALVIGYGNDLRSDDGAGRWVAQQIDDRGLDGIAVRSVAQLTPELALEIAGRSVVVFVDASVAVRELTIDEVAASARASTVMTHHGNPADLLRLVDQVGAQPGSAHVVSIPASNLEMGFEFSAETHAAAEAAVQRIIDLATSPPDAS